MLEIEKQKEIELQEQERLQKEKELIELEKQKEKERILEEKEKASEKLKKSLEKKDDTLSDEELLQLIGKTNDAEAMFEVGNHYFDLGKKDYRNYNLAYHYYVESGNLGIPIGYFNAAISKNNYNIFIEENTDEYRENQNLIMEVLEKTPVNSYYYCAYTFYASGMKKQEYTERVERGYKAIMNNEKTKENSKKLATSAYSFYNGDYITCINNFYEIKEYVDKALLSMFTNKFYDKFNEYSIKFKQPKYPEEFYNPYSKEYKEYKEKLKDTLTESEISFVQQITDWRSPIAEQRKEKLFNKFKNECIDKINEMLKEDAGNVELKGLSDQINEMSFNKDTIVKDIAKLLEIRDILLDE
jgi:hypothetical protein